MPFYIRKRIKIAPGLNLNVSKSGLGLSVGPKGCKVSAGPRGTQINAGRGGLYYRQSLNGKGRRRSAQPTQAPRVQQKVAAQTQAPAPIGQLNGVALDGRQPQAARWLLWTAIAIGVLYMAIGMLVF